MPETGEKDIRPSWVPLKKDPNFACSVMGGIDSAVNAVSEEKYNPVDKIRKFPLRKKPSPEELIKGVSEGDRKTLSQAITLIESNAPRDFDKAQRVLQALLPRTGKALRIGISGVPGAGKSTFIESFGQMLCHQGYKVAVLAVDPTSSITGGSILGDKTRMQMLSREPNCFIRPSPAKGTLGGVARKSRETMLLCEAAGCDVILVETVGVGQSEITVRSMVDFFMLVVLTGAGDDLQGIKKGIMEVADAIVVNKADGDNLPKAIVTQGEYERMIEFIRPATEGWKTHAYRCSALTKEGLADLIYFDGPLLSHYVTNKGDNYLFYWIDQDDTNNRWMFIRTDYDNIQKYTNKKQTLRNVLSSPLDDIVYTVDIDEEGNHHNFQAHSIEDLPEDYLPTEDSYYEFEPEDVNKENLSIAEMSGKKLDWFRKVCAAVL